MESGAVKPPAYKRILLKLSGEFFMGSQEFGIQESAVESVALSIQKLSSLKVQVGVVVGGGNIFRGVNAKKNGIERTSADHIGMLATMMNGIFLSQALKQNGQKVRVMSAVSCDDLVEKYTTEKALTALDEGNVVIFVGGTGNPYFTTDSAAALRALEIHADILFKATKVDGIYNRDPALHENAEKFESLSYTRVLEENLKVMDMASIALCRENGLPIRVFNMSDSSLEKAVFNEAIGTIVSGE